MAVWDWVVCSILLAQSTKTLLLQLETAELLKCVLLSQWILGLFVHFLLFFSLCILLFWNLSSWIWYKTPQVGKQVILNPHKEPACSSLMIRKEQKPAWYKLSRTRVDVPGLEYHNEWIPFYIFYYLALQRTSSVFTCFEYNLSISSYMNYMLYFYECISDRLIDLSNLNAVLQYIQHTTGKGVIWRPYWLFSERCRVLPSTDGEFMTWLLACI